MKISIVILIFLILGACTNSNEVNQEKKMENLQKSNLIESTNCDYIKDYQDLGNRTIDTIRIKNRLVDPIDDFINFEETDIGFVQQKNKIYRKAKTHRNCNEKFIDVEYYQEFTNRIELKSYKEYNDRYFTTKGGVNFWWVNSDGHLIIPINNADPKTFEPFENICGGIDKRGIYYGCPNYGVYQLNIPIKSKFEFIAKENNYWNSPKHYAIVENKIYDIKYELKKGYFCELDETISINDILKLKK